MRHGLRLSTAAGTPSRLARAGQGARCECSTTKEITSTPLARATTNGEVLWLLNRRHVQSSAVRALECPRPAARGLSAPWDAGQACRAGPLAARAPSGCPGASAQLGPEALPRPVSRPDEGLGGHWALELGFGRHLHPPPASVRYDVESWKRKSVAASPSRRALAVILSISSWRLHLSQQRPGMYSFNQDPSVGKLSESLSSSNLPVLRGSSAARRDARCSLLRFLPVYPPSVESKCG